MDKASEKFKFLMLTFRAGVIVARKLSGQGLGFAELAVLFAISQGPEGKIRVSDLAKQVGLDTYGLNRLMVNMEKIGAIKKEPHGRDTRAIITEKGKKLCESAIKLAEMRCEDLIPKGQENNIGLVNTFLGSIEQ